MYIYNVYIIMKHIMKYIMKYIYIYIYIESEVDTIQVLTPSCMNASPALWSSLVLSVQWTFPLESEPHHTVNGCDHVQLVCRFTSNNSQTMNAMDACVSTSLVILYINESLQNILDTWTSN